MKSNLLMDFSVDKEHNKIKVEREFAAPLSQVWAAWTEKDLLDQWWAPKPWQTKTKIMDFRVGGFWLYAMVGPEGEEHYAKTDYKAITVNKGFSSVDSFCDAAGVIQDNLPQNIWETSFQERGNSTLVQVELSFGSLEDLETIIQMGFKEGFLSALENLDELLEKQETAIR